MSRHYLALGDSYTIGESVADHERYPAQLAELFKADNVAMDVTVIARTGWTTADLWQGIQAVELHPPYDLVSLLIGVNNQYRGYSSEEYRKEFVFLLGMALEYAGGNKARVFVVSIPDWGVTPFANGRDRETISTEIDLFNAINREEAQKAGVTYFDITPISRQPDPTLIAEDGLHPSGKMYALWAGLIYDGVRGIVTSK